MKKNSFLQKFKLKVNCPNGIIWLGYGTNNLLENGIANLDPGPYVLEVKTQTITSEKASISNPSQTIYNP